MSLLICDKCNKYDNIKIGDYMKNIVNKSIIIIMVAALLFITVEPVKVVLPLLLAIIFCNTAEYLNNEKFSLILYLIYCIVALFYKEFLLGIPVVLYDLMLTRFQLYGFLGIIPLILCRNQYDVDTFLVLLVLVVISAVFKYKTNQYESLHEEYIRKRDELTEMSLSLEEKINDLVSREDYQVKIATLNERNRIAREIHDNVGHLLSSSIIQIGAVMMVTKEESVKNMLSDIKNTLDSGMNSIRNSVHNLRDESVDLKLEIKKLIDDFTFCDISLQYNVEILSDVNVKYTLIAVVKEALNNVIRHSDATKVEVSLYEHPSLYQLIIKDNGNCEKNKMHEGMGLESIEKRVQDLGGNVNFDCTNGFRIFISIMKDREKSI